MDLPAQPSRTLNELKAGDHLCCLYDTEDAYRAAVMPFLRQGFERGEKVLYIVDTHTPQTVKRYLEAEGVDLEPHMARGQFEVVSVYDTYLRSGVFAPEETLALWREEIARARREGYRTLRAAGEMTWTLRGLPGAEQFLEYEDQVSLILPESHCLALCLYDRRRFNPITLLEVRSTHPALLVDTVVYDHLP